MTTMKKPATNAAPVRFEFYGNLPGDPLTAIEMAANDLERKKDAMMRELALLDQQIELQHMRAHAVWNAMKAAAVGVVVQPYDRLLKSHLEKLGGWKKLTADSPDKDVEAILAKTGKRINGSYMDKESALFSDPLEFHAPYTGYSSKPILAGAKLVQEARRVMGIARTVAAASKPAVKKPAPQKPATKGPAKPRPAAQSAASKVPPKPAAKPAPKPASEPAPVKPSQTPQQYMSSLKAIASNPTVAAKLKGVDWGDCFWLNQRSLGTKPGDAITKYISTREKSERDKAQRDQEEKENAAAFRADPVDPSGPAPCPPYGEPTAGVRVYKPADLRIDLERLKEAAAGLGKLRTDDSMIEAVLQTSRGRYAIVLAHERSTHTLYQLQPVEPAAKSGLTFWGKRLAEHEPAAPENIPLGGVSVEDDFGQFWTLGPDANRIYVEVPKPGREGKGK